MNRLYRSLLAASLLAIPALTFCQLIPPSAMTAAQPVPMPKHEFRAAWVASVENIDWPSKKGLPVDSQKVEFIRLLDSPKRVVFEVTPTEVSASHDSRKMPGDGRGGRPARTTTVP